MKRKDPQPVPAERSLTLRAAMRAELLGGFITARELSGRLGIREKDVFAHLEHLERSARRRQEKLAVQPAVCVNCHTEFRAARRLRGPGRCPVCGSERVDPPAFRLEPER